MGNHVHLLMETKVVSLSKILQGVNQSYTMYFNRRYATVGHLFQGRYKAMLCDKDSYLLSLIKYIHMNPVRAERAKSPEAYPWSSHGFYVGQARGRGIVDSELVLRIFSEDGRKARRAYRELYRLPEIAKAVEEMCGVTLGQLREKKRRGIRAWEESNEPGGEGVWV